MKLSYWTRVYINITLHYMHLVIACLLTDQDCETPVHRVLTYLVQMAGINMLYFYNILLVHILCLKQYSGLTQIHTSEEQLAVLLTEPVFIDISSGMHSG